MEIVVPREYVYVLGVCAASALQLVWMSAAVGAARHRAGVPYPNLFADAKEAEKDEKKHLFNCTQRVHQNTLENFPIFSTLLLIGGLEHPKASAIGGAVYLLGRFGYAIGYRTGKPEKRMLGVFGAAGLVTILYTTGSSLYQLYHGH
ncbi:hypothetical protein BC940DRAFT_301517 [Gongronella butleri]|nr:hypothetical protein BC940DRAFT_301517 [Gongronella butleri]